MKPIWAICWTSILVSSILTLAPVARADMVSVTLTQTSETAVAGSTIAFDATITNLDATEAFLNGDSSATSSTFLSVDDGPFLANFPLLLDPGEASGPFELFDLTVDSTTPPGAYDFNSFSILGGGDGGASDTIGTADFDVVVTQINPVPEPATFVMLISGFVLLGARYAFTYRGSSGRSSAFVRPEANT